MAVPRRWPIRRSLPIPRQDSGDHGGGPKIGNDPNIALNVARQEGLGDFLRRQWQVGRRIPALHGRRRWQRLPARYGARSARSKERRRHHRLRYEACCPHGWGAWNGAKKIGITGYMGIGGNQGAAPAGGGAPEPSGAPTVVLPPEFNMRPSGGYAGLLGAAQEGQQALPSPREATGGPGTAPVLPGESPMEYARRTGLQPGLGGGSGGGAPPVIPPSAGGDYGGGDGGGYLPPAGFGGMIPGQGPLVSSVANLPPMPPPQAAPPVMQGPLAAPPPVVAAAPAGPGPLAAPVAPREGPSYIPQMPGGDAQQQQQLMALQARIARLRARSALAGISGDPYAGYLDLLKNSPIYQRQQSCSRSR